MAHLLSDARWGGRVRRGCASGVAVVRLAAFLAMVIGLVAVVGCSSSDVTERTEATASTASAQAPSRSGERPAPLGTGRLLLAGDELPFTIDTCFEGKGLQGNENLRLHVEGRGRDAAGRSYTVQLVRTMSSNDEVIDVVRVRHDHRPVGASHEAQRVHHPATGEVMDLWGDGTTPLLELRRDSGMLSVAASAVFGDYPGGGGDPVVLGHGDLRATCAQDRDAGLRGA